MTAKSPSGSPPRRRPRDRHDRILAAAAHRYWTEGYHQVSMAQIAADVDIGASALYRHVRGKQELLVRVLEQQLAALETAMEVPGTDLLRDLARFTLEHRAFGVLWERETRHIPDEARRSMRRRLRRVVTRIGAETADTVAAGPRAWAVLSVLASPSHHRTELDPGEFVAVLHDAAVAVATVDLPEPGPPGVSRATGGGLRPASRREALLATASRLFSERGYPSVGLDDIGSAAGMAGPSIYNHFDSKIDVLSAILHRGNEALWLGLHHVLADADSADDGLHGLVADYAAFTVADPEIITALVAETIYVPVDRRESFRQAQRAYVGEWVALLRQARPDHDEARARVLVHAAIAVINNLSRLHGARDSRGHLARTDALAGAVLAA